MRVQGVLTKHGANISDLINAAAGDHWADSFLGVLIAESNLDEWSRRDGVFPDISAGLSHVLPPNLGFGTYASPPTAAQLTLYREYVFDPAVAIREGWRFYRAALDRMNDDPLWAALSYNRGPKYTRVQLEEQVRTLPSIAARFERYRASLEKAQAYVMEAPVMTEYSIGQGVRDAMYSASDEPRSDEVYRVTNISETFGRDAMYLYFAEDNRVVKLPFVRV